MPGIKPHVAKSKRRDKMSLFGRVLRIDLGKQVVSKEQIAQPNITDFKDPTGLKQIIKEVTERLMKRPGTSDTFSRYGSGESQEARSLFPQP